ncbi:MAG TPA: glucosaminidase domain-containing protein [Gaiellaceae bacterium]|nr:glucosaminidase domain-containing protein [Gaiellaceae bacterium]
MSMKIVSRKKWGAAPPKGKTSRPPNTLDGVAVHWFGSPKAARSHDGCEALLRSVQASHLANTKEGYVDIAYSHAVCPHGFAYELRGFGVQAGANGTTAANRSHAAIVYMAGDGDRFTEEAKPVLAELIRLWQSKGAGLDVKPHGFFVGTTCPGPDIRKWIDQRGWKKKEKKDAQAQQLKPTKDDVHPWLTSFLEWRLVEGGAPKRKPKGIPAKVPESAWQTVTELQRLVNFLGPQDPFLDWCEWRLAGSKKSERPRSLPAKIPKPWSAAFERVEAMVAGTTPEPPKPPKPPKPAAKVTARAALLGAPGAERAQLETRILGSPHGGYSDASVRSILRTYDETARSVGLDPLLVVAQMVLETGNLTSDWSQVPKRNPAGIGVTGEPGAGIRFPSWKKAVRAHCGRLLAYALPKGAESAEQKALIDEALGWRPLPDSLRGAAPTLSKLTGRWATDPGYAAKIVRVANELRSG